MSNIEFYGDVHWENIGTFITSQNPYVFNFEYVIDTENAKPLRNKIIVTGSGDFDSWGKKPIAVNLANNHIMDLGDLGFQHTLSVLKRNNIAFFGAGDSNNNYNNPCMIEIDGKRVAFLGYCDYDFLLEVSPTQYSCSIPTMAQISHDMELCQKNLADIIIVNIHWGREERSWHNKRQEIIGHCLIDAGADLVIGHHPHCIQPIEYYNGKYIFYSLGNTFFPNLNTPSYYNKSGKSEFNACVRHLKCGRKSLKVQFDIVNKKVSGITRMEYKNNKVVDCGNIKNLQVVLPLYQYKFWNELIGYWRRIVILIKSNIMVEGRLINGKAFKKELEFIQARQKKKVKI
jgi:poly-gamma-glutamate synthesis protein (capsule biosynthesis protein)